MPNEETSIRCGKGQARLTVLLIVLLLVPFAYSVVSLFVPKGTASDEVFLERPPAKYKSCVKETDYMRYHHWELLRETREQVVRYGIRGEIALDKCRECHESRERFCNQCHNAVSLTPDCFQCHYYP
jgi:hypothetical protein